MKKFLFIIAVLTAQVSFSQNCDSIMDYEKDKMDDSETWFMKSPIRLGEGKGSITSNLVMGSQTMTVIWINTAEGAGCIDKGNRLDILFTDGTKLQLSTHGTFNCQEKSTFYFHRAMGTEKHLDTFCEKTIATIRVWSMKTHNQQDLSEADAIHLRDAFKCLRDTKK
jgi:hypothetical protein